MRRWAGEDDRNACIENCPKLPAGARRPRNQRDRSRDEGQLRPGGLLMVCTE
jgi:hypothetical protein